METEVLTLPQHPDPLQEAVSLLQQMPGSSLPVRDPVTGRILALLVHPDFPTPPPRLGGMATPLGVYLTDGVVSGGAGFWGLVFSGMTLGALGLGAEMTIHMMLSFAAAHGFDVWTWANSPHRPAALRAWMPEALAWLPAPLIFVLLRLLPMSGTHAAEHQVVHCVEQNRPLALEEVRAQPRVHPRCGTNLFVGLSLFLLVFVGVFCVFQTMGQPVAECATLALAAAAVPSLLLWRRLGGFVQQWFATRPATNAQILGAIRAAEQVLSRRAAHRSASCRWRGLRRVWNMGFAQVVLGYFALYSLLLPAMMHWPRLERWLGAL